MTELPENRPAHTLASHIGRRRQKLKTTSPTRQEIRSRQQSPTVFTVEDDDATRESITAFLKGRGYRVCAFASCEEFLAQLDPTENGCLLLDYHFDGMTGFELLDALRARGASLPTILYTGRFDAGIQRRAAGYPEVVAFLQKPLGGTAVTDALVKALASG